MDNSAIIQTKELVKVYPMGQHNLVALDHVNLTFQKGEFAGVVGPSGSGKTTLLNIMGSLDTPIGRRCCCARAECRKAVQ